MALRKNLDNLQRAFDLHGELDALDQFEAQALTLLTNPQTKEAFDLSKEDERTRDRYGRNTWGQQLLMARRLVEAGVEVLTTSLRGPICGRVGNWDDHAVNHHVFDALRFRADAYDQAVTALIEDLYERGLDKRVLVVVTGEFGRTPKIELPTEHRRGQRQRAGRHQATGPRSLAARVQQPVGWRRHRNGTLHRRHRPTWRGRDPRACQRRRFSSHDLSPFGNRCHRKCSSTISTAARHPSSITAARSPS